MSEHTEGFATFVAMELRAECARKRLSGRELAHHIHRPVTTVSRWLNGTKPIGVDDLARVCESIGVGVAEIARRAELLQETSRAEVTANATSATPLASVPTPADQVTYVTKRYRDHAVSHIRTHLSRSDMDRSRSVVSPVRSRIPFGAYADTRACHKIAS